MTDDVRRYKREDDRRYVKEVFIRFALQPHAEKLRPHGLETKHLHFNSKLHSPKS